MVRNHHVAPILALLGAILFLSGQQCPPTRNESPIALDDAAVTEENHPVRIENVLANDSDPEGAVLTITDFSQPTKGHLSSNGDGSFEYTPQNYANGPDSFRYTVSDSRGKTASAMVTITIQPIGRDIYLAPSGHDDNPGTIEAPLATLEKAQQLVRQIKATAGLPEGGITVWLRQGIYERKTSFSLSGEDSGTPAAPVVYSGYPGETVRLVGALRLDPADFSLVTPSSQPDVWTRLDLPSRGRVWQINLATYTTDYGQLSDRGFGGWSGGPAALELFFNGRPMELARWPDKDQAYPFVETEKALSDTQFSYSGNRPERWGKAEDLWLHGYWKYLWADRYMSVAGIDTASKTIQLTSVPGYGLADKSPYYALNLLEEITTPGEWYLSRPTGMLYFWPPESLDGSEIFASILGAPLLLVQGASDITIQNLTLDMSRVELARIESSTRINIDACVLRNAGLAGLKLGGSDNRISRSEIYDTGNDGVVLSGGDRARLIPGNNRVENCHIHHFSRWVFTYTPAIWLNGIGQRVSHNHIEQAPHSAILFGGNNHLIDYNDIHDVCIWSSDAGAIYSGRDWSYQGNQIRFNFIHHITTLFEGYGVHGVYLDDCLSGVRVFGNTLYEIKGFAIHHGGGWNNFMENNVISRCGTALQADNRGTVWIKNDNSDWDLLAKILAMHYQNEPWQTAYPALAEIPPTWEQISDPSQLWLYPYGSTFSRNIGYQNQNWMVESNWSGGAAGVFGVYASISDNIANENPQFVDEGNLDLTLSPDSPAYSIPGFEAIPFAAIGIQAE